MTRRLPLASIACCALTPGFATSSPSLPLRLYGHLKGRASTSNLTVSPDSRCGGSSGYTCLGSKYGNCCSETNYCGANSSYCGTGCQRDFGTCENSLPISTDGSCGGSAGTTCQTSDFGNCCSTRGYCGSNSSYCGAGCQNGFGTCISQLVSSDGSCGGPTGIACLGSDYGNCCSERGYCGTNSSYCGAGCQSGFGTCFPASTSSIISSAVSSQASQTTFSSIISSAVSSQASQTTSASATSQPSNGGGLSSGAIAGTVIGAIAGLAVIGALAWFFLRRHHASRVADTSGMLAEDAKSPPAYGHDAQELGPGEAIYELPNTAKRQPLELSSR